ncbi:hypothetical protein EYB45_05690 [Erythrobacteraceae bacterium CFH 75059]|uniref:hypothetical protein n=1 Tax=Qipengyuania thermophila TaxID=2509361 RepID=UPI0010211C0B|nr:hypothetical protein [Qipengyuania thermophila]TCD05013.1 hypothetical protein EYB45_05690 [Erythrobacteraceae bacterium CFH 75059]
MVSLAIGLLFLTAGTATALMLVDSLLKFRAAWAEVWGTPRTAAIPASAKVQPLRAVEPAAAKTMPRTGVRSADALPVAA